jgi:hypothetical protein
VFKDGSVTSLFDHDLDELDEHDEESPAPV